MTSPTARELKIRIAIFAAAVLLAAPSKKTSHYAVKTTTPPASHEDTDTVDDGEDNSEYAKLDPAAVRRIRSQEQNKNITPSQWTGHPR